MAMVAASRLLFAVARDGVSPLSKLDRTRPTTINSRGTPRTRWWSCSHLQRCRRAPLYRATVAVTSFISADSVSTVAVLWAHRIAHCALRPLHTLSSRSIFIIISALGTAHVRFDGVVQQARLCSALVFFFFFIVLITGALGDISSVTVSSFYYLVVASMSNFACTIFGSASIFAILSWFFIPANEWVHQEQTEGHPDGGADAVGGHSSGHNVNPSTQNLNAAVHRMEHNKIVGSIYGGHRLFFFFQV